ncbi:acyltransferase family protein [Kluyvera sp. CHPC 1.251]|uniref:acyltransferase family protein n=1 Tax=Kluyvera sp. CHPC 1.251 TaxID=2995175 RepID=UPI002FD8523A
MEIKSLTGLRGLAALYVVAFHLTDRAAFPEINGFVQNGYIAVDFFFVLSGFIMSMVYHEKFKTIEQNNYINYMYNRFSRIYPLYVTLLFSTLILDYLLNGRTQPNSSIFINTFLLQSITAWNYIASSWSLSTELIAYLLFPFIIFFMRDNRCILIFLMAALATLAILFISKSPNTLDHSFMYPSIARCIADYILGIGAYIAHRNGIYIKRTISYICFAFLSWFLTTSESDLFTVILFVLIVPSLVDSKNLISTILSMKPLHYIGEISYSIYLIHSILINQFKEQMQHFENWRLMALALTILLSMISFHLVENPSRKWLKNKRYKMA